MVNKKQTRGEIVKRQVFEEFKAWKSHTPFLYDLCISHAIQWPSLTVEWLPERVEASDGYNSVQNIIIGTHADDNDPNYLIIAQVRLPLLDDGAYDEYSNLDREDDHTKLVSDARGKIKILHKIPHDGEVNWARHQPQDPYKIATKTTSSEVHLFDCRNHPIKYPIGGTSNPDVRLIGHTSGRFFAKIPDVNSEVQKWFSDFSRQPLVETNDDNPRAENYLKNKLVQQRIPMNAGCHQGSVNDVSWHWKLDCLSASCGDDGYLHISDYRMESGPVQSLMAHPRGINSLSFNPLNESLVATGSTDKTLKVFDMRNLTSELYTLKYHTTNRLLVLNYDRDEVVQIEWNPHNKNIIASSSSDRRLVMWDTSRVGQEQLSVDVPPELLFIHAGHTDRVPDFSWNPTEDWVIASVADDTMLQVWQMKSSCI
ncbi:WD40 repeat-containing protein MSI1 [Tanacetum coccineum]|uniref:WD40 repeat-containing protein MSI1 n=1 Tax=Tanacetum coccineum TaxID=301880 RepID=A0ABQ5HM54_9ASTR